MAGSPGRFKGGIALTNEELRPLIAHWPKEAEYELNERWELMGDFWSALDDTRRVWARDHDISIDAAKAILAIKNEEGERKQWNKLQAASACLRQQRLY